MTKKNTEKQEMNEGREIQLFREYIRQNFKAKQEPGTDKEFLTSRELVWRVRDTIPSLGIGEVCKVMGELGFETAAISSSAVWVLYRIDGEKELEKEFGV